MINIPLDWRRYGPGSNPGSVVFLNFFDLIHLTLCNRINVSRRVNGIYLKKNCGHLTNFTIDSSDSVGSSSGSG